MSEIGGDVSTIVTRMGADLSREAAKMTNESVKQLLIYLIQKAKEQQNVSGQTNLKRLLKSNDEIKLFDLEQKHLKEFAQKSKKYEITYAVIEDQGRHSVFYKQSDENRIKNIIENFIQKELTTNDGPEKQSIQQQPAYEILDGSQIKVPNAVLDINIDFQRDLAERQGIYTKQIDFQKEYGNENEIAGNRPDDNRQPSYEVVDKSHLKVNNVVLDMKVDIERDLAENQGVKVNQFFGRNQQEEELYDKAVELTKESGQVSLTQLQENLNLRYTEARNLIDRMEAEGLVSNYDGTKPQQYIGDQPKETTGEVAIEQVQQAPSKQEENFHKAEHTEQAQGRYEIVGESKIRVPSVTLDMNNAEHKQLAESYGIKVAEIDFKRETSDLNLEKADIRGKESLHAKLGSIPDRELGDKRSAVVRGFFHNVEGRLSLAERREQIGPIMAAAKDSAPTKNKIRERGGR